MPIFEYICKDCGHKFEKLEIASKKSKPICPKCNSIKIEKQFSVFNAAVKQGQSKKCNSCNDLSCPHSNR